LIPVIFKGVIIAENGEKSMASSIIFDRMGQYAIILLKIEI